MSQRGSQERVKIISIDIKYRRELRKLLNRLGINRSTIYPGLDGVAGHIKWMQRCKQTSTENDPFSRIGSYKYYDVTALAHFAHFFPGTSLLNISIIFRSWSVTKHVFPSLPPNVMLLTFFPFRVTWCNNFPAGERIATVPFP